MNDILDHSPNVTVLLSKVQVPKTSRGFSVVGMGRKDPPGLSLGSDNSLGAMSARLSGKVVIQASGKGMGDGLERYLHP